MKVVVDVTEGGTPVISTDSKEKVSLALTRGEFVQKGKIQSRGYVINETLKNVSLRKGIVVDVPTAQTLVVEQDRTGQVRPFFHRSKVFCRA